MPIYRTTIMGREKPLLIRAETAAKGLAQLVTIKALTAEEMAEALASGDKVWTPGDEWPADDRVADLENKLADSTEGRDAELQHIADEGAAKPGGKGAAGKAAGASDAAE